jgi:hypothetical protein
MITNTSPASSAVEEHHAIEQCPSAVSSEENCRPMTLRLQGRWEDIMAALDHWRIEFDCHSGRAISQSADECVVYGTLSVEA